MTPYEQSLVCFLEKFPLINIHELLDREGDVRSMDAYLREWFLVKSFYIILGFLCLFLQF
jgi:hypothetical protein